MIADEGDGGRLFFWRSRNGAEVDLVLRVNGQNFAYEIKANPKKRGRFPASFMEAYAQEATATVHPDNFAELVGELRGRLG